MFVYCAPQAEILALRAVEVAQNQNPRHIWLLPSGCLLCCLLSTACCWLLAACCLLFAA
jgi:hypothetical protein